MMLKTRAIVLHKTKYGDSKLIVDMLTREQGRVAFIISIPASGRGRMRKQMFQPLTLLNIEYDDRSTRQLQQLRNAAIAVPFSSIPFDVYKMSTAMFVAEFLVYATHNEQANPTLYDYVENSICWLDACVRTAANFHLVLMMRMSLFLGLFPNLDDAGSGAYFDLRSGCFTPQAPMHPDFMPPDDAAKMRLLMRMTYDNMHLFAMSRDDRNRCVDIILRFYRLHIPDFPEMRSLEVVKTLFK